MIGGGVSGLAAARLLAGANPVSDSAGGSAGGSGGRHGCGGGGGSGGGSCGGGQGGGTGGEHGVGGERGSEAGGAGASVILLEASDRLGGKVSTGLFAGGPVELGPDQ